MAKFEKTIQGDFEELLKRIEAGILEGSMSASLEATSDFQVGKPAGIIMRKQVNRRCWAGK